MFYQFFGNHLSLQSLYLQSQNIKYYLIHPFFVVIARSGFLFGDIIVSLKRTRNNKLLSVLSMSKGHTNNPNGRPKGTPNKSTSTMKNWIIDFVSGHQEQIESDFQSLEPRDRLMFVSRLLPYVVPKMVEVKDENCPDSFVIHIE